MYRRGTSLPTAPLEAEQPPDAKRTDEGGERERTGIHQSADHNLDGDRHQERQRGAEKQGKRDDGQLRPGGNAFHGVGDLAPRRSAIRPAAAPWGGFGAPVSPGTGSLGCSAIPQEFVI